MLTDLVFFRHYFDYFERQCLIGGGIGFQTFSHLLTEMYMSTLNCTVTTKGALVVHPLVLDLNMSNCPNKGWHKSMQGLVYKASRFKLVMIINTYTITSGEKSSDGRKVIYHPVHL